MSELNIREWIQPLNPKGTWWILNSSNSKPCPSHQCPVPRRINIGSRYQAEVPELRQRSAVELDHHRAELVWAPLAELEEKPDFQEKGKESTKHAGFHCCYITSNWKHKYRQTDCWCTSRISLHIFSLFTVKRPILHWDTCIFSNNMQAF